MDCIDSVSGAKAIDLLTQTDKILLLEKTFAKHRPKSDVFLPDEAFYNDIAGPEDVERMADILFKWLGMKHRSLSFHIDPDQDKLVSYKKHGAASSVTLGWKVQADSFLCAAAVAHAIVHHILLSRSKITLANTDETEELTDLGTIYAGFGVIVLNSFSSPTPVLGSLATTNYVSECQDYLTNQRIVSSLWSPFVLHEVLEKYLDDIQQQRRSGFVNRRLSLLLKRKKTLFLMSGFIALTFCGIGLYLARQPKYISPEAQARLDAAKILKSQFEQCEETVRRKQQTWDTNDIFMQRHIEVDASRCASLRSRYNHEVTEYNSRL